MGTLNSVKERLDYLIKIKKMSENAFMKATGTTTSPSPFQMQAGVRSSR